jgi:hypothetical protein
LTREYGNGRREQALRLPAEFIVGASDTESEGLALTSLIQWRESA